jgi:hypothetical protein
MTCMLLFVRHESRAAAVLSPKIVRRRLDIATSSDRQDDLLQIIATTEEEAGAGYHSAEEEAEYHLAAEEEARSLKVAAEVEVGFRQSHSSGRVGPDLGVGQKERQAHRTREHHSQERRKRQAHSGRSRSFRSRMRRRQRGLQGLRKPKVLHCCLHHRSRCSDRTIDRRHRLRRPMAQKRPSCCRHHRGRRGPKGQNHRLDPAPKA